MGCRQGRAAQLCSAGGGGRLVGRLSLTDFLAGYGAIVATATAVVHGLRLYRERAALTVSCYIGEEWTVGVGKTGGPRVVIHVTNTGGTPITVTAIGGHFRQKPNRPDPPLFFLPDADVPKRLEPYASFMSFCDLAVLDEGVEYFAAQDGKGVSWKAPDAQLEAATIRFGEMRLRGDLPKAP